MTYDGPGNLTKAQDTTGGSTTGQSVSYGVFGNSGVAACGGRSGQTGQVCTVTDGRGNITRKNYDSRGDLITVTPPAPLGASRYTYDALGRVTTVVDGKSQTTRYSYDGLGRTTRVLYAGATTCTASSCISYDYDPDGNLLSQTDGGGTIAYRYDLLGRQTGKTLPGQPEQVLVYDSAGNLTSISDPGGVIGYRYDAANQLISLAEPGGSCTASPTVRCTTFGYDNNGKRTRTTYPTGASSTVMTLTPDDSGRVKRIRADTGSTVQSDFSYTYATAAGDTALTQTRVDNTADRSFSYDYDSLNQLTAAEEKITSTSVRASLWTYGYDKAGNRTSAQIGTGLNSFAYNAANQITSRNGSTTGWAHDANGNETAAVGVRTRTSTVNPKDQNVSFTVEGAGSPASYLGASQKERTTGANSTFTDSAIGLATSTTSGLTNSYVRDPDGTLVALRTGGASYYYLFDGLGSVVGLVNSAGSKVNTYSYDPYGRDRRKTETVDNNFEYIGGWLDNTTGLYKLGIRYYDPTLGRFTQPDPTGQDPHYTYARNNPVTYTDPTGALSECTSGVIGAVAGIGGFLGGTAALIATPLTGGASTIAAVGLYELSALGLGSSIAGLEAC